MEIKNLKSFFSKKKIKNILLISGKKSFKKINGEKYIKKNLNNNSVKINYFFKKLKNPEKQELLSIVR